jgi:hypothetical protein
MRDVAMALEGWLSNHGYRFDPGGGDAMHKASDLTSGRPNIGRGGSRSGGSRSGGSRSGGSKGGSSGSGKRLGVATSTGKRLAPSRSDDTVYDKARAETKKGMDKDGKSGDSSGGSDKRTPAKGIPKARPLDGSGSDKKSNSGQFALNFNPGSGKSGATPVVNMPKIATDGSGKTAALKTGGPATSGPVPLTSSAISGAYVAASN